MVGWLETACHSLRVATFAFTDDKGLTGEHRIYHLLPGLKKDRPTSRSFTRFFLIQKKTESWREYHGW